MMCSGSCILFAFSLSLRRSHAKALLWIKSRTKTSNEIHSKQSYRFVDIYPHAAGVAGVASAEYIQEITFYELVS